MNERLNGTDASSPPSSNNKVKRMQMCIAVCYCPFCTDELNFAATPLSLIKPSLFVDKTHVSPYVFAVTLLVVFRRISSRKLRITKQ